MENDKISNEHFITEISIEKVRHLKNIDIALSKEKRNHLIFTGKNGSGKTSILNAIKSYLKCIEDNNYNNLNIDYPRNLEYSIQRIDSLLNDSSIELNSKNAELDNLRKNIRYWENELYII
jgi:predicted ATP-binding protein involved in virulence